MNQLLLEVDGLEDVSSDFEDPYVEHVLKVDQQNVLQYGLTTGQIVMALATNNSQEVLTSVENDGDDLNVVIKREERAAATSLEDVLATEIDTAFRYYNDNW